jgi:hypothetical protein
MASAPPGFNDFLALKYQQLQQHADATTLAANSAASEATARNQLTGAQAANVAAATPYIAGQAKAGIGLTNAQAGQTNAQANSINTLLPGQVRLQDATAGLTEQQGRYYGPEAQARIATLNANATGSDLSNYNQRSVITSLQPHAGLSLGQFLQSPEAAYGGAAGPPDPLPTPGVSPRYRRAAAPLVQTPTIAPSFYGTNLDPQTTVTQ